MAAHLSCTARQARFTDRAIDFAPWLMSLVSLWWCIRIALRAGSDALEVQ